MKKQTTTEQFEAACKARGLRVTHQRSEVYRALVGADWHPSAEDVYWAVRRRIRPISPDTVYRTLDTLEEIGLIGRFKGPDGRYRFDANRERHQHLVCEQCGKIEDIHWSELEALKIPRRDGWDNLELVQVELSGRCQDCRAGEPEARQPAQKAKKNS